LKKWIVLFLGIICIAISAIFVKQANVNGLVSALYRIVIALLVVAPIKVLTNKNEYTARNKITCMAGGIFFGFELAFWNVSVMISNATMPTLLVNLSAVWVGLGAFFFLKEKVFLFHWIGTIIASFFLAGYTLTIKKARTAMDTFTVLFYALLGSSIPLIVICLIYKLPLLGYSAGSYFYLVCLGVVTQVGGYFSINYALGHISSIKVSLITLLQPVMTAVFASIIINEVIPSQKLVGGLIVLAGIGISFVRPAHS
jgi:drug/metabolite transporter (DMT)-like permease